MKRGAEKQLTPDDVEKEEESKETETPKEDSSEKKEETTTLKQTEEKKSEEKKPEEKKPEENKTPLFSFGTSATSNSSPFNFSFPTSTSSTSQPFSFGSSQSFTFSFATTTPFTSTSSEKKEEEDDDPEKDLTTNDGPVKVKTLAKEELTNGEEGEENVYTVPKMKLYELVSVEVENKNEEEKNESSSEKKEGEGEEKKKEETKEPVFKKVWQERGLGVLRLNVDKKTNVARILIRREPTHQSVANFNIIHETKVSVDGVRKQVTIQTIEPVADSDSKEEKKGEENEQKQKAKISFYMIRVSTKEIAEELCAKISEHIPKKEDKEETK